MFIFLKKFLRTVSPVNVIKEIRTKILLRKNNIIVRGKIHLKGYPIIELSENCRIELHDNITLNSINKRYHVNMHSPVKLRAFAKGANILIKKNTRIHGTCVHATKYIEIGERCLIGANCQIFDGSGHDVYMDIPSQRIYSKGYSKPVIIGDDVWIGINSIILPGTKIGRGSVIRAGSIVVGKFPDFSLLSGNPARIIKDLTPKISDNDLHLRHK